MSKIKVESRARLIQCFLPIYLSLHERVEKLGGNNENIYRLATPDGDGTLKKIARLIVEAGRVAKKATKKFLRFKCQVIIPARSEEFVAKDFFAVNTEDKSKVKINSIDEEFEKLYLGKKEKPFSGSTLAVHGLTTLASDEIIIAKIGAEKVETTLYEIYAFMAEQSSASNGGCGKFIALNYFYVRDINDELGLVGIDWVGNGWDVHSDSLGNTHDRGSLFFSRN